MTKAEILKREILSQYKSVRQFAWGKDFRKPCYAILRQAE